MNLLCKKAKFNINLSINKKLMYISNKFLRMFCTSELEGTKVIKLIYNYHLIYN